MDDSEWVLNETHTSAGRGHVTYVDVHTAHNTAPIAAPVSWSDGKTEIPARLATVKYCQIEKKLSCSRISRASECAGPLYPRDRNMRVLTSRVAWSIAVAVTDVQSRLKNDFLPLQSKIRIGDYTAQLERVVVEYSQKSHLRTTWNKGLVGKRCNERVMKICTQPQSVLLGLSRMKSGLL
jgi:hypothetical protein